MLKDQTDLLAVFNAHEVRYLIIGGHAVNIYTEARSTKDLDVWVDPSVENSVAVFRALAEYGAPLAGVKPEDFQEGSPNYFQIGIAPDRIDVVHLISGVDFASAWAGATHGMLEGVPVRFISRDHLIANKRASGRARDIADVEEIEKFKKED